MTTPLAVFLVFLRLGLTSFGGPVAHLGYFRDEFVTRRRWLSDAAYADLVALAQFLPGPASSQVGIAVGYARAGVPGALLAWLGFTLPSAAALTAFAFGVRTLVGDEAAPWLRGLSIVAVAVVAQAVWGMARSLAPDPPRFSVAVAAAIATAWWPGAWTQIAVIAAGAILGLTLLRSVPRAVAASTAAPGGGAAPAAPSPAAPPAAPSPAAPSPANPPRRALTRPAAAALLALLGALLIALPVARDATDLRAVAVVDAFFRTGAIVFGGGHVVLPLLRAEVAPLGVGDAAFTAGYGAAQAVPGPLFTFAAYLGASLAPGGAGVVWAAVALAAVFLPSFLLVLGVMPFWEALRGRVTTRRALAGVNAAVVGLLLSAWYDPVFTTAIATPRDFALALLAFAALSVWRLPPWLVVGCGAAAAALLPG